MAIKKVLFLFICAVIMAFSYWRTHNGLFWDNVALKSLKQFRLSREKWDCVKLLNYSKYYPIKCFGVTVKSANFAAANDNIVE